MSPSAEPRELQSLSPTTGEVLGKVPRADHDAIDAAVAEAAAAAPAWAGVRSTDRARYMRRTARAVIAAMPELATLISREQGKPRSEASAAELLPSIDALQWIADRGPGLLRDARARPRQPYLLGKRHRHVHAPLGVVAVVSAPGRPWLEPFLQTAIAVMCGNGVVLRPAPETPLTGARVERTLAHAGLPEGLVRVVQGGDEVAEALAAAEGIAKVFFSGSEAGGRRVEEASARAGRPAVLELGGKDAQIVLHDARLDHAVAGALWGAFAGGGQPSGSIERIYVAREVAETFLDRLVEAAGSLRVGDPLDDDTDVGPLLDPKRAERAAELIDEAVASGARLWCGGRASVPGLPGGAFFAPAVLTEVPPDVRLAREPLAAPVTAISAVGSEEEAVARANDSPYGLGASVWTSDRARGERIARRLRVGMAWVNDHRYSFGAIESAWGGVGASGHGRVHGEPGFRECVETKLVGVDAARFTRPWWPPYDRSLGTGAEAAARLLYGPEEERWPAVRAGIGPLARIAGRMLRESLRRRPSG